MIAAMLGASCEADLLKQASSSQRQMSITACEEREALLTTLRETQPDAVVFPAVDGHGLPTAPLIGQCATAFPQVRLVVLCCLPPARANALLAASRAGARVLVTSASTDIAGLLGNGRTGRIEHLLPDCVTFACVQPQLLRDFLDAAVRTVVTNGHVAALAQRLHVSPRTLSRHARSAGLASPSTVLAAVRLLWATAMLESSSRNLGAVARATGLGTANRLLLIAREHMVPLVGAGEPRHLPCYGDTFRHVIRSLGGRVD